MGSSPRVRGKLRAAGSKTAATGLIPACAGKTIPQRSRRNVDGAHPRVCGENCPGVGHSSRMAGSSPRVRGKHPNWRPENAPPGLIPACAGKTPGRLAAHESHWAHPRVCGENATGRPDRRQGHGSSPRVRGKPRTDLAATPRPGLIPACAGKTFSRSPTRKTRGAHPRVCGENRARDE